MVFMARSTRQHNVIKFVSDLRQVGGFLQGTPVSSTNKTDHHDITELEFNKHDVDIYINGTWHKYTGNIGRLFKITNLKAT
jgi:hypothetical protein